MRMPTAYENYLRRMEDYYKIKNIDKPEWIDLARIYYGRLLYSARTLSEMCANTNIPKSKMEYLANLESIDTDVLPRELSEGGKDINAVLKQMYEELVSNKDEYFVTEWTLTKKGRRKMREYIDSIPSARGIMPPNCEFNNVPGHISLSNRIYSTNAEYELFVSMDGSRIGLKSSDAKLYLDFTERFLDLIIPMMQWERIENMLHKKNRSDDRDESVYQDFKMVLVDINRNEYDLNLLTESRENPFMQLLKLVWEEYEDVLKDNNMVLPWFSVLGWM